MVNNKGRYYLALLLELYMPTGILISDEFGQTLVDMTTRMVSVAGSFIIPANSSLTGSFYHEVFHEQDIVLFYSGSYKAIPTSSFNPPFAGTDMIFDFVRHRETGVIKWRAIGYSRIDTDVKIIFGVW